MYGIDLNGKVAVVTGSEGGIGSAVMGLLEEAGATCVGLDMPDLDKPRYHSINVTNEADVEAVFAWVKQNFGRVDILVNSAGILGDKSFLGTSMDLFDKCVAVNLRGTFMCMQQAGRMMKAQGDGGVIINLSSVAREGNRGQAAYSATKAAVSALTAVAGKELGKHGIRSYSLAPSLVNTPMIDDVPDDLQGMMASLSAFGRKGEPDDIAKAVLMLCSDLAGFITAETITVGGLHLP